MVKLRKLPF